MWGRLSFFTLLGLWLTAGCEADRVTLDAGSDCAGALTTGGGLNCQDISGDRRDQVCLAWACRCNDMTEGVWSGDAANCNAGELSYSGHANALALINMYRFLAGVPPVDESVDLDAQGQGCALLMDANRALSHTPPSSWKCYTADVANAALNSLLASGPSVAAIPAFMDDDGAENAAMLGHRRWLLSNSLGPIGIGSTVTYSCVWVTGGSFTAGSSFTAWPPPGPVPLAALGSVDTTGWTVQSDSIDLSDPHVVVSDNTLLLAVSVTQLLDGFGSAHAIAFKPSGWSAEAGHTYDITVTSVASPIEYSVEVINCP